jgi:hypothetical protein
MSAEIIYHYPPELLKLGWTTASAMEKTYGASGTLLRETKGDLVWVSRPKSFLSGCPGLIIVLT